MSSDFWFWSHFVLVTISHFLVVILTISTIKQFFVSTLPFLDRGRRLATMFFIVMLGVNHLTNTSSKCILTTMENEARAKEGRTLVGDFMPRYYRTIGSWFK